MNSQNHNIILSCIPYYLSDYLFSRADIVIYVLFIFTLVNLLYSLDIKYIKS